MLNYASLGSRFSWTVVKQFQNLMIRVIALRSQTVRFVYFFPGPKFKKDQQQTFIDYSIVHSAISRFLESWSINKLFSLFIYTTALE